MFSYIFSENFSLKRITSKIHFSNNKHMNKNIDKTMSQLYEGVDIEELNPHKDAKAETHHSYEKSTNYEKEVVRFSFKPMSHESLHDTYMVLNELIQTAPNLYNEKCSSFPFIYGVSEIVEKYADEYEQYLKELKQNTNDM